MAEENKSEAPVAQAPAQAPTQVSVPINPNPVDKEQELPKVDELTVLKQRADQMGITYSNNIGVDTLREKIQAKLSGEPEKKAEVEAPVERELTQAEKDNILRNNIRVDALKLVRIRLTNLNPNKKDLHGEIITVSNRYIGTVRKYVPFNEAGENGWHVPQIILDVMRDKRFLSIRTRRVNGREVIEQSWAPEFAIEVLPPLTEEELQQLANRQAAANGSPNV